MIHHKPLRDVVNDMTAMADALIPHTHPLVPVEYEMEVLIMKQRIMTVDGYELMVTFSKADYGTFMLESLQIHSQDTPFLPFNVVCKLGRAFLGKKRISYTEFFNDNKKIYCWQTRREDGRLMPPLKGSRSASFEGFNYTILPPKMIELI